MSDECLVDGILQDFYVYIDEFFDVIHGKEPILATTQAHLQRKTAELIACQKELRHKDETCKCLFEQLEKQQQEIDLLLISVGQHEENIKKLQKQNKISEIYTL